jgi:hypothetical protein
MFTTAAYLVEYLAQCPLRRCVVRALMNGKVEVLGGFSIIPPGTSPGFIVKVESYPRDGCPGQTWYVAAISSGLGRMYARVISDVPWENWVGKPGRQSIYEGDHPDVYERNRTARLHPGLRVHDAGASKIVDKEDLWT